MISAKSAKSPKLDVSLGSQNLGHSVGKSFLGCPFRCNYIPPDFMFYVVRKILTCFFGKCTDSTFTSTKLVMMFHTVLHRMLVKDIESLLPHENRTLDDTSRRRPWLMFMHACADQRPWELLNDLTHQTFPVVYLCVFCISKHKVSCQFRGFIN